MRIRNYRSCDLSPCVRSVEKKIFMVLSFRKVEKEFRWTTQMEMDLKKVSLRKKISLEMSGEKIFFKKMLWIFEARESI